MIEKNIGVLRKIMYAAEIGGLVYGKQRYDAFIGARAKKMDSWDKTKNFWIIKLVIWKT